MKLPKINLIIATYAGKYNSEPKDNILKLSLKILNKLNPLIDRITIMKPKINVNHKEIYGYYDFNNINLDNIINKIKIIECNNIGISYGQFFNGIYNDLSFDYYILIEDDYVIFKDNFQNEFIEEFKKNENDSLLCSFIYKNKYWDIIPYSESIGENNNNINLLREKLIKYNIDIKCDIPDFSLCLLSKYTVNKIINKYNLNQISDIFDINFEKIWIHQILFGYIINSCNIKIYDLTNSHINIFYHTANRSLSLLNFGMDNKKYKSPLFIPIQVLDNSKYFDSINNLQIYVETKNFFFEYLNNINYLL
jgi:hypothetical protein